MVTRSFYLYQPMGGKPSSHLRDAFRNPVRCVAILLIVALSLSSIAVLLIQRPRGSVLAPNLLIPTHGIAFEAPVPFFVPPALDIGPLVPDVAPPVLEVVATTVYHPFVPPSSADSIVDQTVRPIEAHGALSDSCLDVWVSTGLWQHPCRHNVVQDATIDLVYIWVNGSDILHQTARNELLNTTKYRTGPARFREHDELRYSLRSARNATASWRNSTWHIITADVADPDVNSTRRLGLVPQWLDVSCAFHAQDGHPPIRIQHDTQLFRLTGKPGDALDTANATDWLAKIIPSFNSHAVESQLPQLDPKVVSENIVALNDDQFMSLPLPPSAFHTTLYGQVFRMDPNLLVSGDPTGYADGGGEWRSLGWSSYLLNERFGTRERPYIQHNARALSLPLMHEMALAFGSYFAATPLSQFRGSHQVPGEFEVNTIFMATHFVIERHREALLWSWIVGKWGGASGIINREQKERIWRELGGGVYDTLVLLDADRSTIDDVEANLLAAGLQLPSGFSAKQRANTTYSWVSMDGYSPSFHDLPELTIIERGECIGKDAEPAWDMFRRLAGDNTTCGDNIIASLIHSSNRGLSIFLPPPPVPNLMPLPSDPIILPLELPSQAPPLPANPRAFAVRLLMRYAYVLGQSSTIFVGLRSPSDRWALDSADRQKDVALICINDDLEDVAQEAAANAMLHDWFDKRWPEKLQCEL